MILYSLIIYFQFFTNVEINSLFVYHVYKNNYLNKKFDNKIVTNTFF